jgi:hypothetical protein
MEGDEFGDPGSHGQHLLFGDVPDALLDGYGLIGGSESSGRLAQTKAPRPRWVSM